MSKWEKQTTIVFFWYKMPTHFCKKGVQYNFGNFKGALPLPLDNIIPHFFPKDFDTIGSVGMGNDLQRVNKLNKYFYNFSVFQNQL